MFFDFLLGFTCFRGLFLCCFYQVVNTTEEHRMEIQKQPVMATKEQLRLAELTQTGNDVAVPHDDSALQKRVKKTALLSGTENVIELTRCTLSQAEVALIDSEDNVEDAVARLLDNPEKLVLWSQQGKNKKAKGVTPLVVNEPKVGNGRRADSQRARQRQDGAGQQNTGQKQYQTVQSRSLARPTQTKEQNGPNLGGPRTRNERQGFKGQGRTFTGGAYRRDRAANEQLTKAEGIANGSANQQGGDFRTWTNGEGTGTGNVGWGDSTGWDDEKKMGKGGESGFATVEASYGDTQKDDEWKNGPRVFMPSSAVVTETSTNSGTKSASNWPALENYAPSEAIEPAAQKPKTFAAVAAAKKAPPPPPPPLAIAQRQPQQMAVPSAGEPNSEMTSVAQNESTISRSNLEAKMSDGPVVEWSNSIDWGNSLSPQPSADQSEFSQLASDQLASTSTSNVVFGNAPVLSMSVNVNQEYTDQLKNAIGLVTNSQPQHQIGASIAHQSSAASVSNSCDSTADYIQQHNHLQCLTSNNAMEMDRAQEKVEFVTGDALPPPTSTSYQFGFHFSSAKDNENAWGPQQHIPTVEISTGAMLNPMSNIPTTSSSVSAHFNAISQQAQAIEAHQRLNSGANRPGNALSFSDTASVNFPPSSGQSAGGGSVVHANPSNFTSQQNDPTPHTQQLPPQNKTLFTPAANPSMVSAPPAMQQHLQQQAQTIFHQTSAAAVPQFPNYNMPYMYSPVAAAQTLTAPNAEIDRFLIQQYGTPYSQLDLQMGAMSIGPPTTLAPNHHRATLDSYMENKFGQQQQNINQVANNGHYQQSQQSQQQRGLAAQSDPAALLGGPPSHVGPPPGFGMPTAPTQPSYVQPANIHSLFQMPTYPHPYQHPQYMMSNANRFQTAQRPAQTSPPEGNVQNQRRGGNEAQGYTGAAGQDSTGEQHSAGVSQQYGNNFNHKYRSYM